MSPDSPHPAEFRRFIDLLMADAPEGYEPWLFRCAKESKAPAVEFGSWKDERNRLTPEEAVEWLEEGGNIGISGMPEDRLVNVDIDDTEETDPDELKPTLTARSRSREGLHGFYWSADGEDIPNIPTDDKGEVRAQGQYVVAPGSYVPTDPEDVPDGQEEYAGLYTVENEREPAEITREELPAVFKKANRQSEIEDVETPDIDDLDTPEGEDRSAVYDVTARDVAAREGASTDPTDRWESAFHGSTTGENMSLSNQGLIQCWRHGVAHNGLQALAAMSDYPHGCADVGAGHENSGAGPSCIKGDDSAHWYAWKFAKENGYIPEDDPVPYGAIKHICRARELCPPTDIPDEYDPESGDTIPRHAYNGAIESIREYDGLNPGRERVEPETRPNGGVAVAPSTEADDIERPGVDDLGVSYLYDVLGIPREVPLRKINNNQVANAIETMLTAQPDAHLRVLDNVDSKNQEIYSMDRETKVWDAKGEQRIGQIARSILGMHNSKGIQSELANALRTNPEGYWLIDRDAFGAPRDHFPVKNGLLNLVTRERRDPVPEDYLLGRTPTEYDAGATIEGTRFEKFLMQSVSPADLEKLQEYAGYCLLHDRQPYKKALFLFGPTNSGKGTFIDVITAILGQENVASESLSSLLDSRWGYHQIYGSWLNVSNELTPDGLKKVEKFKTLTGAEDRVTAEDKHVSKYEFTVTQKFIFATNQFPEVDNADKAFFKRCLFAEFPNTVDDDKLDPELVDKLKEERSAILDWMLDGLDRLRENGGQFTNERSLDEKRDITKAFGSPIDQFAYRAFEVTNDADHVVHKKELYAAFTRFCDFIEKDTPTQRAFTGRLKEIAGVTDGKSRRVSDKGNRKDVFQGIQLNEGFFKKIQADLPSHSYDPDGEDGNQSTFG